MSEEEKNCENDAQKLFQNRGDWLNWIRFKKDLKLCFVFFKDEKL